jgi:hypothetical protein
MATTTKTFDCVEMKHKAAAKIRRETRGMTLQQELAYWAKGTKSLLARRRALVKAVRGAPPKKNAS